MRSLVVATLLLALAARLEAQDSKHRCKEPADSSWFGGGAVYRDCEVDKKAQLRGGEPRLDMNPSLGNLPSSGCMRSELEFVIDTTGQPVPTTVRPKPGNNRDLQEAMITQLTELRYTPARIGERAVRQIVSWKRVTTFTIRSSAQPVGSPRPPANC